MNQINLGLLAFAKLMYQSKKSMKYDTSPPKDKKENSEDKNN
jgi:hypothetical protein